MASVTASVCRVQHAVVLLVLFVLATPFWGLSADDLASNPRVDPAGIPGSLVLVGGGSIPSEAREQFMKLAGGDKAKIVVIPTARNDAELSQGASSLNIWEAAKPASTVVLHTRSRDEANSTVFVAPLQRATAVWFDEGSATRLTAAYAGTAVEREILAVLHRGGVIGGTSTAVSVLGSVITSSDQPGPNIQPGFNILPGAVIEAHYIERQKRSRLPGLLEHKPGLFGLGIDDDTAVVVRGRTMDVIGAGNVSIRLGPSSDRPAREIVFKSGEQTDLTRWRFAAHARTTAAFPAARPAEPRVAEGSLVIVGGGGVPSMMPTSFFTQ